ncbi:MAG: hypothetical protein J1E35_04185 [Lachnospiraceae bacterium]|nr:hypothetical protein [Lachnospiraceae bacterium]
MGIERYREIVKLEDIRTLFENGEYDAAKAAADGIRRERLKDSPDLFLLAALYRKCGEYKTAKEFLLRVYKKKATWRVLEELMEVCLAEKNPQEAEVYLKEYCRISGGDPRNYIYEYRIGRQMHRPDEELLPILQTLKAEEYTEKYGYELAKLYHKLGRGQECMAECADLVLWFGEGTYVERAKVLQAYYRGELSAEDIATEAERRIREAKERKEREEREAAELRAQEEQYRREAERPVWEEQYRPAEESKAAEELRRFEEEERSRAEEAEAQNGNAWRASEEVPEAEINEPMWEPDGFFAAAADESETPEEEQEESEEYEQISLFAAEEPAEETAEFKGFPAESGAAFEPAKEDLEEDVEENPEENLTQPGEELSARLSAGGVSFEEALRGYARIERVRKQVIRMSETVITAEKKCHCLIITGERQSGKTTLGTYLAKLLYELSCLKSPRVAKIGAQKLNQITLSEKKEQLRDCCLIIEGVEELTGEAVAGLLDFINNTDVLGAVILEDNANVMKRFLRDYAECDRIFDNRVQLPKYDSGELMSFALEYIREQDYEIGREAKGILKQETERLARTGKKEGRLAETMKLVKTAIANADSRNREKILTMAATGNFLAAEAMELAAEDFGVIR